MDKFWNDYCLIQLLRGQVLRIEEIETIKMKHKITLVICLAFTSSFLFAGKGNIGSDKTNYIILNPNLYGSNPNLYDLTEVSGQTHGITATKQVEKTNLTDLKSYNYQDFLFLNRWKY